jgi:hypothetical protein
VLAEAVLSLLLALEAEPVQAGVGPLELALVVAVPWRREVEAQMLMRLYRPQEVWL